MVSEPLGSHQMAESSNSNPSTFTLPNITYLAPTKLDDHNYLAWEFQFQPILKTYGLMGIVDGSEPSPPKFLSSAAGSSADKEQLSLNPEYFIWERKDQFILSWFIANLTEMVVPTIYGMTTAKLVWNALANRYANPSRSRINQLRRQLQMLRQCTKNCAEFVRTAKMLADQLAILGKPVGDDDLISYIVGGLKPQYNSFVTSFSFANKDDSMDLKSFLSQLLSYEQLIEHQNQDATAEASSYALLSQRPNHILPNQSLRTNHNVGHNISQSLPMSRSHVVLQETKHQEIKHQVTMLSLQAILTLIGLLVKSVVRTIIRLLIASTVWISHSKEDTLQVSWLLWFHSPLLSMRKMSG